MENSIARKAEFELLKHRLLLRQLDEMPDVESHALVIYEAEAAASLASLTPYPFLIFPCLFEERARATAESARGQEHLCWSHLQGCDRHSPV
jgi:hypothetical protein